MLGRRHFDERADLVEHVHIEADVDDAEVDEAGGEHAPPLMGAEGQGAEVAKAIGPSMPLDSSREQDNKRATRKNRAKRGRSAICFNY